MADRDRPASHVRQYTPHFAWFVAAGLVALSLVPPSWRVVTGAPRALEHFAAFAVAGLLFAIAYPRRRLVLLGAGIVLIAGIEVLQIVAPGRHAYLADFAINAIAFALGVGLVTAYERLRA